MSLKPMLHLRMVRTRARDFYSAKPCPLIQFRSCSLASRRRTSLRDKKLHEVRFGSMLSKNAVAWFVLLSGGVFGLFLAGHRIPHRQAPRRTWQAPYAIAAQVPFVGGPSRRSAIGLRFCTMAAG